MLLEPSRPHELIGKDSADDDHQHVEDDYKDQG